MPTYYFLTVSQQISRLFRIPKIHYSVPKIFLHDPFISHLMQLTRLDPILLRLILILFNIIIKP
jgi:hypothetical protein